MTRQLILAVAIGCLCGGSVHARDERPAVEQWPAMQDSQFKEHIRMLRSENRELERLRSAKHYASRHRLTSLQVKAIVESLGNDSARLDFALEAFPSTIDPDNYYEVYDGFKTFSKVMRLHDGIREMRRPRPERGPWEPAPREVGESDMADILRTIAREGIDSTKQNLARQIIGARNNFSARQIKQIIALFAFESSKLEIAKFSFDHVLDPENYFMVNEAFAFSSSKDELSNFIESRKRRSRP
jgi:hypothetical protein